MSKIDLSIHLSALSIAIVLHAPVVGVVCYLLGLLVGSGHRRRRKPSH